MYAWWRAMRVSLRLAGAHRQSGVEAGFSVLGSQRGGAGLEFRTSSALPRWLSWTLKPFQPCVEVVRARSPAGQPERGISASVRAVEQGLRVRVVSHRAFPEDWPPGGLASSCAKALPDVEIACRDLFAGDGQVLPLRAAHYAAGDRGARRRSAWRDDRNRAPSRVRWTGRAPAFHMSRIAGRSSALTFGMDQGLELGSAAANGAFECLVHTPRLRGAARLSRRSQDAVGRHVLMARQAQTPLPPMGSVPPERIFDAGLAAIMIREGEEIRIGMMMGDAGSRSAAAMARRSEHRSGISQMAGASIEIGQSRCPSRPRQSGGDDGGSADSAASLEADLERRATGRRCSCGCRHWRAASGGQAGVKGGVGTRGACSCPGAAAGRRTRQILCSRRALLSYARGRGHRLRCSTPRSKMSSKAPDCHRQDRNFQCVFERLEVSARQCSVFFSCPLVSYSCSSKLVTLIEGSGRAWPPLPDGARNGHRHLPPIRAN